MLDGNKSRNWSIFALLFSFNLATAELASMPTSTLFVETQLTSGPPNKDLDDNINFSPDGRYLVFDCRGTQGIGENTKLGRVDLKTGEVSIVYEQKGNSKGVGAASFLNKKEIVAIHALESDLKYDFTVRGGMIIASDGSGRKRWLDSRNVIPPFTPGALRGGTHKHEPDGSGQWIGFTYNDHIMKTHNGSDLRNVGVSKRGIRVPVPAEPDGRNFNGESFTVLLTRCVENPKPGTDEYQRAEGDCWVGMGGYRGSDGKQHRARAFRGTVIVEEGGNLAKCSDVFIVDIPEDITKAGTLGPLEGTETDYPKPPSGTLERRLTRTAELPHAAMRGVTGHLRASGDGRWIACVSKAASKGVIENQVFVVSPSTGEMRQLSNISGGVSGDPRFSPDGRFVAIASPDGSVYIVSARMESWGSTQLAAPACPHPATNLVVSPKSRVLAYNREVEGVRQIFMVTLK